MVDLKIESEIRKTTHCARSGWKKINKAIDRYHFLLDSYSKLMEACSDTSASYEKWLTKLTISSWLTHVKEVLNCGCLVAQCVAQVIQRNVIKLNT